MKMVILILKDHDSDAMTQALTSAQYRVTRIASTGGFLRSGVVTLLLGVRAGIDPQQIATAAFGGTTRHTVRGPSRTFRTGLIRNKIPSKVVYCTRCGDTEMASLCLYFLSNRSMRPNVLPLRYSVYQT